MLAQQAASLIAQAESPMYAVMEFWILLMKHETMEIQLVWTDAPALEHRLNLAGHAQLLMEQKVYVPLFAEMEK